jgi:c-di-GMP-binding flagellar brake protein YcgR
MENQSNKRKAPRFNCLVPVDGKDASRFARTKTVDISPTGIGFISDHPVPLNEKIAIELALRADADPVLVIGEVKWVRKMTDSERYRIGLTFSDIIEGSAEELDGSLRNRFVNQDVSL